MERGLASLGYSAMLKGKQLLQREREGTPHVNLGKSGILPISELNEMIRPRMATSSLSGLVGVAKLNSAFRNGFGGNSTAYSRK